MSWEREVAQVTLRGWETLNQPQDYRYQHKDDTLGMRWQMDIRKGKFLGLSMGKRELCDLCTGKMGYRFSSRSIGPTSQMTQLE